MTSSNHYTPDYCTPPWETVDEMLEERNIGQDEFRKKAHLTIALFSDLKNGEYHLDDDVLAALAGYKLATRDFWLARDRDYWVCRAKKIRKALNPLLSAVKNIKRV